MNVMCRGLAAVVVPLLAPLAAVQAAYPDKPIRVIIPGPPGGSPDQLVRALAPGLLSLLGQPLVIDNRSGAGGLIGTDLAIKAAADGYTLILTGTSMTILPHLQKQAGYDPVKDFAPIGEISNGPYLLTANLSVPFRTVKELIAFAKAQPGKLNYASAGNGSPIHLGTELFKSMAGVNLTHVPYKGVPQALTDLLGGSVNLTFSAVRQVQSLIKAGRLRALGISSHKRLPLLPDVPTIIEAGVPGYEWGSWYGLLAPARTPRPIIARLNDAMVKVLRAPDIKSKFEDDGNEVVGSSPEEFAVFIRREFEKNGKVVKLSGLKVD